MASEEWTPAVTSADHRPTGSDRCVTMTLQRQNGQEVSVNHISARINRDEKIYYEDVTRIMQV
ncbi:hypothetical protein J6590_033177 [Homalodisca vitripennis]|nr:hypothetical protein J6590_033177 [Homalodisca vitripennis]